MWSVCVAGYLTRACPPVFCTSLLEWHATSFTKPRTRNQSQVILAVLGLGQHGQTFVRVKLEKETDCRMKALSGSNSMHSTVMGVYRRQQRKLRFRSLNKFQQQLLKHVVNSLRKFVISPNVWNWQLGSKLFMRSCVIHKVPRYRTQRYVTSIRKAH